MPGPGGRIMHAEIKIGNSVLMLADENTERGYLSPKSIGGTGSSVMFYTDDVDATFKKAMDAGAKSDQPPTDMPWGDRMANITDPFGHNWAIATHTEDVSPEEMERRMKSVQSRVPRQTGRRRSHERRRLFSEDRSVPAIWHHLRAPRSESLETIPLPVRPDTTDHDRRARSAFGR